MKKYEAFLADLRDGLQAILEEAENAEWHHASVNSSVFHHYERIVELTSHVEERLKWWNDGQDAKRVTRISP